MVVDSGFRCHLSQFTRATAAAPSPFVTRLRKYLRTRRVTSVLQVGTDRIIELQFSDGQYRLFLEFYAGGNVVLTDSDLVIIALLRIVPEGPEQEELRVGLRYSLDNRQNYKGVPDLTRERLEDALRKGINEGVGDVSVVKKNTKRKAENSLRKALARSLNEFPPMLLDHALHVKGFNAQIPLEEIMNTETMLDQLMDVLNEAQKVIVQITSAPVSKGFIVAKTTQTHPTTEEIGVTLGQETLVYEDFHPFRPAQFEGAPGTRLLKFEPFNKTVDEFFSSIESQKLESRLTEREENARRKLDAARIDHKNRLGGLQQVQELNVRKAKAIEANFRKVQEATTAVNGLIAQGMDWVEIARLIEMEHAKHNAIAEMIKLPLKLSENTVTLLLTEANYEDEADFEGNETGSDVSGSDEEVNTNNERVQPSKPEGKGLAVDVDLALSPWSNARQYYDQKKSAAVKEQKTLQSSAKALKNTERKVNADLKKGLKQEKQVMRPVRDQRWFEKFLYFISSESYLVLGGRDAQQSEMLYQRYLRKGDVYVHADLQGAASVIVKNKPGMLDIPIPPSTLSQAGTLAVATSSAWNSKAVMSAWWVKPDQVSRTAPTGEYLTTGPFTIRGQKNYLPPAQLLLGFGVMFQVSEESKARHLKHRLVGNTRTSADIAQNINETAEGQTLEESVAKSEAIKDGATGTDVGRQGDRDQFQRPDESSNLEVGSRPNADGADKLIKEQDAMNDEKPDYEEEEAHTDDYQFQLGNAESMPPNPLQSHLDSNLETHGSGTGSEDDADRDVAPSEAPVDSGHTRVRSRQDDQPPPTDGDMSQNIQNQGSEEEGEPATQSIRSTRITGQTQKSATKPQAAQVRGKHGKRNKQKTKYANQDEDDRALALRLLGSAAGQQRIAEDAAMKKAKEGEQAAQKERRRKQHALAVEKGKEVEEIRRLNMEEGIDTLDDAEIEGLNDLDAYVGTPLPGDEILDALVICGPWDAIGGKCRWRAKLQPGATMKGKAVREILGGWIAAIADREKRKCPPTEDVRLAGNEKGSEAELIKAIREQEVIGVVPVGKCRVIMGAGEKANSGKGGGPGKGKRGGKGVRRRDNPAFAMT